MLRLGSIPLLALSLLPACDSGSGGSAWDDADFTVEASEAVEGYVHVVTANYGDTVTAAKAMQSDIRAFLSAPSEASLQRARAAWLAAREVYGQTEVYRFYGGPIDDEQNNYEGLINSWPLDEVYIDYVEGDPEGGIINDLSKQIDRATLIELNGAGGEDDISTGWHAIEFLLWGQDLSADGPGARPYTDYVTDGTGTAKNQDRRAAYLEIVTMLLVEHLTAVDAAWAESAAYHDEFERGDPKESLTKILLGMGSLSGAELSGERRSFRVTTAAFVPPAEARVAPSTPYVAIGHVYAVRPESTLAGLVDGNLLTACSPRLTVGAVNVKTGRMRYFDSGDEALDLRHILASGALPPAFPAVRIGDELFWDGGIYSNTPVEAVFDDNPRRNSLVFAVQLWQGSGVAPQTMWQVSGRQKDIQFSSRVDSHVQRQAQIHQLRHIVRELTRRLPASVLPRPDVREMTGYGCGTVMHLVRLVAPRLPDEDHTKDMDFHAARIRQRWQAGLADARRSLARQAWLEPVGPMDGLVVHDLAAETPTPQEIR